MNYSAMIQNRRSVHAFREKEVPSEAIGQLRSYYEKTCPRLVPEIATELIVLDKDAQPALESSAGYNQFLIGAPHYLLLMSAPHSYAAINAGYMMEDLVLKLTELDIDTCWMTFTDSDKIKKALSLATPLEVAAIVAFGYGEKTAKKLRLNILSMSQIDVRAEQQYYAPKKGVNDLVHMGSWSNKSGLDEMMDFYDDMLWQSIYAASLSPSYLNRQPYGFLVQDHSIYLVQQEDAYTDNLDAALDLGIVHAPLLRRRLPVGGAGTLGTFTCCARRPAGRTSLRCGVPHVTTLGGSKATVKCATVDPRLSVCFIRKEEPIRQSLSKENRRYFLYGYRHLRMRSQCGVGRDRSLENTQTKERS